MTNNAMSLTNATLDSNLNLCATNTANSLYTGSAWGYWTDWYYPQVIRESYPVYIKERAEDKGKQAFEIIKSLQDKKLLKLDKVSDFIEAMDTLIKIL